MLRTPCSSLLPVGQRRCVGESNPSEDSESPLLALDLDIRELGWCLVSVVSVVCASSLVPGTHPDLSLQTNSRKDSHL